MLNFPSSVGRAEQVKILILLRLFKLFLSFSLGFASTLSLEVTSNSFLFVNLIEINFDFFLKEL
jgi:hypothetical protein